METPSAEVGITRPVARTQELGSNGEREEVAVGCQTLLALNKFDRDSS